MSLYFASLNNFVARLRMISAWRGFLNARFAQAEGLSEGSRGLKRSGNPRFAEKQKRP
jgi:hypothetical protein